MVFSSFVFIFYFLPVVLLLYYMCRFSALLKNTVLLVFSLLFYAWGSVGLAEALLVSIMLNYLFGLSLNACKSNYFVRKCILAAACVINLSILLACKYLDFFTSIINDLTGTSFSAPEFGLHIGISFFTLQAISYVVDVYREKVSVQKNPLYLGLYISFFGKLEAGPIVQYGDMAGQLSGRKESLRMISVGCCRFVTGMAKKLLIADSLAVVTDRVFDMTASGTVPVSLAYVGAIAYTLQIYHDFSGYSGMAIGLGLMFGFRFEENFSYPYIAKSVSEFCRRWHNSLRRWMRDYVYIPLGGSRLSNKDKVIYNIFVVWLLTGLWHGAEWTFLIWGVFIFIFVALERLLSIDKMTSHKTIRRLYTLFIVNIGWVIFRADDLQHAGRHIASMFGFFQNGFYSPYSVMFLKENMMFFIAGIIFSTPIARRANKFIVRSSPFGAAVHFAYPVCILALFLLCLVYLTKISYHPFIFFDI